MTSGPFVEATLGQGRPTGIEPGAVGRRPPPDTLLRRVLDERSTHDFAALIGVLAGTLALRGDSPADPVAAEAAARAFLRALGD